MKPITEILFDKKHGTDCTEDESAYIKGWLRETIICINDGSQQIIEDIQLLFPLEYDEHLTEMENMKHYIDYLNKDKGFKRDRKYFESYEMAEKWAKENFERFDLDMIYCN